MRFCPMFSVGVVFSLLLILFLLCTRSPVEQRGIANTKMTLFLENSMQEQDEDTITDKVGETVTCVVVLSLPMFVDSVELLMTNTAGKVVKDTVVKEFERTREADTVLCPFVFLEEGTLHLKAVGYVQKGGILYDFATIRIGPSSDKPDPNSTPKLVITGKTTVEVSGRCSLTVAASVADSGKRLKYSIVNKPEGAVFAPPLFIWSAPAVETVIDSILFIVTDSETPRYADSLHVTITVVADSGNMQMIISGSRTVAGASPCTLTVAVAAPDTLRNVTVQLVELPSGATFAEALFIWQPPSTDTTVELLFIATDKRDSSRSDSQVVTMIVTWGAVAVNHPPVMIISGKRTVLPGAVCSLFVAATDPDGGQKVTFASPNLPRGARLASSLFTWPTPLVDSAILVLFIATDNGVPARADTLLVTLQVLTVIPVPEPPSAFTQLSSQPGMVTLQWQQATYADYVIISRARGRNGPFIVVDSTVLPSYTDTATADASYYYLQSVNAKGLSVPSDTLMVLLQMNTPPQWMTDTITLQGRQGEVLTLSLREKYRDADGDTCTFQRISGSGTVNGATFSYTVDTNSFSGEPSYLVVEDKLQAKDTLTLIIIVATSPVTPLSFTRVTPATEQYSVQDSALTITFGYGGGTAAMVRCVMQNDTFTVEKVDTLYRTTVTGLTVGEANRIAVYARGGAATAVTDTLVYAITAVPLPHDTVGPSITQKQGPGADSLITNPLVTFEFAVTDQSGITRVSWVLNDGSAMPLTAEASGVYVVTATLTKYHANSIALVATDSASPANTTTHVVFVDYNPRPVAADKNVITAVDAAVNIVLTADAVDGDNLVDWKIAPPNSGVATLSGTTVTYTPSSGFVGKDTLAYTVSDGKSTSAPAIIIVTVTDNREKPIIQQAPQGLTVCDGNEAVLTVQAVGTGPLQYLWRNGTVAVAGGTAQQCTTLVAGDYTVIVSNALDADTSSVATVVVSPTPEKPVVSPVVTVCEGDAVTLTATVAAGATLRWFSDSCEGTPLWSTYITPTATSTKYWVCAESNGCLSACVEVTVAVVPKPEVPSVVVWNSPVCPNTDVTLEASGGSGGTITWYGGTQAAPVMVGTGTPCSVRYTTGSVAYFARSESDDCFSSWAEGQIWISPAAEPTVVLGSGTEIQKNVGEEVTFTAYGNGIDLQYQWMHDGDSVGAQRTTGTYTIAHVAETDSGSYTCVVIDACGKQQTSATATKLRILSLPGISNAPDAITTCAGADTSFTVEATGEEPLQYEWTFGGTVVGTTAKLELMAVTEADEGDYIGTVTNSAGTTSATVTLTVAVPPEQPIVTPSDVQAVVGENVQLTLTGSAEGATYQWFRVVPAGEDQLLEDGTSSTLTLTSVAEGTSSYYGNVSTSCGSATSNTVNLTVAPGAADPAPMP